LYIALPARIDQSDSEFRDILRLPAWDEKADMPMTGEFPFSPEEAYANRVAWDARLRSRALLFCFIRGIESVACLLYNPQTPRMKKICAQNFPG
jgi:hypothetical protein